MHNLVAISCTSPETGFLAKREARNPVSLGEKPGFSPLVEHAARCELTVPTDL